MWASCREACEKLGLPEPWADVDATALRGPPNNAQILELSFASGTRLAPLQIALRADLAPVAVKSVMDSIGTGEGGTFYRNEAVPCAAPARTRDLWPQLHACPAAGHRDVLSWSPPADEEQGEA